MYKERKKYLRGKAVLSVLICTVLLSARIPVKIVQADSLKIYYPEKNQTVTYTKKQIIYRYDDVILNLDGAIGLLTENEIAIGPYYDIFVKSLGVSYSKNGKTLTLKKGKNTLVLTLGDKTAVLNGVRTKMNAAPLSVRFLNAGITRIMVPTRFVAEALGFAYRWDSSTSTVIIQDYMAFSCNGKQISYIGAAGKVEVDGKKIDVSKFPVLQFKNTEMMEAYRIFSKELGVDYFYDRSTGEIQFQRGDLILQMREESTIAWLNGIMLDCGVAPVCMKNHANLAERLLVPGQFVAESLGYGYKWDSSVKTAYITTLDLVEMDEEEEKPIKYFFVPEEYELTNREKEEEKTDSDILPDNEEEVQDEKLPELNYLLELERGKNENGFYFCFRSLLPLDYYELSEGEELDVIYFDNIGNSLEEDEFPEMLFEEYFDSAVFSREEESVAFSYRLAEGFSLDSIEESDGLYLYFEDLSAREEWREPNAVFISLPEEVSFSDIKVEDQYWNKKIVFTIPGKWKKYYKQNPIVNEYPVVQNISIQEKDGKTQIVFLTARIQGYTVKKKSGGFSVCIGEPSKIYDKILVLDAGHGGEDSGAYSGKYREKDINFAILYDYARIYFEKSDIKVYYSRRTDIKVDLYERADFASQVEADLFISLHMNAHSSTAVKGTSVYYSKMNTSINRGGLNSEHMAAVLTENLSREMGTKNKGVYTEDFVVIRMTRMPSVLIELAFLTNESDRSILTNKAKQKIAAKTIFDTVTNFFKEYPTGRE